jgi:twitching motility protein PilT
VEVLINTAPVRKYILEGRESEIREIMLSQEAEQVGMIDFNGALVKLVEAEYIHMRVAMETTPNADELRMRLKGIT